MRITATLVLLLSVLGLSVADASSARGGLQVSFATEQGNWFGSGPSSHTQLVMLQPQLSLAVLQSSGRPQLEIVTEYTAAWSIRPVRKFLHTVNVGARTHLFPRRSVGGYFELGAGIGDSGLFTDPSDPTPRDNEVYRQTTGRMQYHLQVGGGLRVDVGECRLLTGWRLTHLSNRGTQMPNLGLNAHTFAVNFQLPAF